MLEIQKKNKNLKISMEGDAKLIFEANDLASNLENNPDGKRWLDQSNVVVRMWTNIVQVT